MTDALGLAAYTAGFSSDWICPVPLPPLPPLDVHLYAASSFPEVSPEETFHKTTTTFILTTLILFRQDCNHNIQQSLKTYLASDEGPYSHRGKIKNNKIKQNKTKTYIVSQFTEPKT